MVMASATDSYFGFRMTIQHHQIHWPPITRSYSPIVRSFAELSVDERCHCDSKPEPAPVPRPRARFTRSLRRENRPGGARRWIEGRLARPDRGPRFGARVLAERAR